MKRNLKCLRLQLKGDQKLESRYIIIHTHYAIYSHLIEQGHTIAFYEASDYRRNEANPVMYIKTDHPGFYQSCCQYYAHDFDLSVSDEGVEVPKNFRLMLGADTEVPQLAY